MIQIQNKILQA